MKNKSPNSIQLSLGQTKRSFAESTERPVQVNSWVNTALTKKQASTEQRGSSQMVEVHFAFSKSILNRR
jgi:hypothetical protein